MSREGLDLYSSPDNRSLVIGGGQEGGRLSPPPFLPYKMGEAGGGRLVTTGKILQKFDPIDYRATS